jgi:hypothetical protein
MSESKQAAGQKRQPRPQVQIRVTIAGVTYETTLAGELVAMKGGK